MAGRKRTRKKKSTKKVEVKPEMTFDSFFVKQVNLGKFREFDKASVWAFLKDNGLKEKEDLDTYQNILEKY